MKSRYGWIKLAGMLAVFAFTILRPGPMGEAGWKFIRFQKDSSLMKFRPGQALCGPREPLLDQSLGFLTSASSIRLNYPGAGDRNFTAGTPSLDQLRETIFLSSCASCHNPAGDNGGLLLDGYNAYGSMVDVVAHNAVAQAAGKKLVAPGNPEQSFLYQKLINHLQPGEGDAMPQTLMLLPPDKIQMVYDWIRAGAVPTSLQDISLPIPNPGGQVVVPPFQVPVGTEVQANYYSTLSNAKEMRVTRFEVLYPPGSHHLNFFTYQGGLDGGPPPDGSFIPTFDAVPFAYWAMRAGNQRIHLIWDLPPGVAFKFDALQKVLAQIHFVNTGPQTAPIGGTGIVNLHAVADPSKAPITMGTMFGQNVQVSLPPHSTTSWDFGVTFDQFGITDAVTLAAATGHFHWRGKSFEIRLWDGRNKNALGSPIPGSPVGCQPCAPGQTEGSEFDRMGVQNRISSSSSWGEPPFVKFPDGQIKVSPGTGIVYRATYVNDTDQQIEFGPHVENQEHCNVFIYFYPGPSNGATLAFPLPFQR